MVRLFIELSDRDKRFLLILFLLIIVVIALIAVIGALITRLMRWQGKRMDDLTHDVVITNVIENKKQFLHYARMKNWRLFFLQSWKPLTIMLVVSLVLLVRNMVTADWSYNLVDYNVTGFNTIFFIFDFDDPNIYHNFFGLNIICDWPKVISYPHFSAEAWASYIFFFGMVVGGIWYLVTLQCVIARTIRMYRLASSMYHKSLEGYNKYGTPKPTTTTSATSATTTSSTSSESTSTTETK